MKNKNLFFQVFTFLYLIGILANSGAVYAQGEETAQPNAAPSIVFNEPQQNITVEQGEKVSIVWEDEDPDDNALIGIAYDVDADPTNAENYAWIVQDLAEDPDGEGDRYEWDTTEVPAGTYYIWASISDSSNAAVYALAAGTVTIQVEQAPVEEPTQIPTEEPSPEPTQVPTEEPTTEPTVAPSAEPTQIPTEEPSPAPTQVPTTEPTQTPTVEPTKEPEKLFGWEFVVDLNDVAKEAVDQSLKSASNELSGQDVSIYIDGNQLVMKGERDIEQLRFALFDSSLDGFDFLGGPIELNISMPTDGSPVTLKLEDRITTGYAWYLISSPEGSNVTQSGESTFESRYSGIGASSLQTIKLTPAGEEDVVINLVYQRPFEPGSEAKAELNLSLSDPYDVINLSDPTPKQIIASDEVEESGQSNPIDELVVDAKSLPSSYDWRSAGIVPAVRDQGSCGSCWAFGTVGIMESAIKKAGGPLTDLSEQFLISCNTDGWDCVNGGLTAHKYHYNKLGKNQTAIGAVLESVKPYTASNGSCTVAYSHPYKLSNWAFVTGSEITIPTVDQIKTAIYNYGPVTTRICVGPAFHDYNGGVFSTNESCSGGNNSYHQIILVGWNDSTQSWILRNSWGPSWGENGYMRIKYNTSRVGEGTSWVIYNGVTVPTPISPSGTITDTTPTYTWSKIGNATKYQYQLYQGSTRIYAYTVSAGVCGTTNCSHTPTTALSAGAYQWRVGAYVDGAWKTFSANKSFTLNVTPTPISPSGTIYDTTPTYSWNKINGVTKYYYQLFKGSTLVYSRTTLASACGTSICTSTPSDVLSPGSYKWYIRAYAGDIWHPWSSFMNFTVSSPVPTPISPSGTITDTTPTYTWSKISSATKYQYQLYQGSTNIYTYTVSAGVCGTTNCSHTPTTALSAGDYQWRVGAYVDGAWKTFSANKSFTLNVTPTPVSPSGTITDTTPTYTWSKIGNATKYQYQLYQGSTRIYAYTVSAGVCGTTNCSHTPTTALSAGAYQWRVGAYVDGAWKTFSANKSFTLESAIPTPISPSHTITFTTPTYTWSKINGATYYEYQLYKGSTLIYANTVSAVVCGTSNCINTPSNVLITGIYNWRVRAFTDGVWQSFSANTTFTIVNGFTSEFTTAGDLEGWVPGPGGTWYVDSGFLKSDGSPIFPDLLSSSVYYNRITDLSDFTVEASLRMPNVVDPYSGNQYGLIVRGFPKDSYYYDLTEGYSLNIWQWKDPTAQKHLCYSVYQIHTGSTILLTDRCYNDTTVISYVGYNVLKIIANGTNIKFFINDNLVLDTTVSGPMSGNVIIYSMSRNNENSDTIFIPWVKVGSSST